MPDDRPNLLLVFGDQQRFGVTGAEGNRFALTPTIDALAAGGTLVRTCVANAPVCCPSRATMLTGTYPTTHRVLSNDLPVRTDLPTLATVAKANGYRTGYVGKWHLDGVPRRKFTPPGPRRLGFDDYWCAYNCTHDYFNARYYENDNEQVVHAPGYEPTVQTDRAIDFLTRSDDRPFLLAVSWGPPHDPYAQVPQAFRDKFANVDIPVPPNAKPAADNPLGNHLDYTQTIRDYYAAVSALDAELARLLAALEATGRSSSTFVVFTSDHGDMLWAHGWMKKQSPYDESIRVPLVVRGPGIPAGSTDATTFGLIDLMPTALALLGLPVPTTVEGQDRSAALRGHSLAARDALILNQHSCDEAAMQGMPEWRGLRTPTHTYAETVPGVPWLLFDNVADPQQLDNLIDSPAHAALRTRLAADLHVRLVATSDPFLPSPDLLAHFGLANAWTHREAHIND